MTKELAGSAERAPGSAGSNDIRTGSSRILGAALIVTSVLLFAVAFVTGFLPFELASLVAFVLGIALLAVELEARVRLGLAADSMVGYLHTLDGALKSMRVLGGATYVPLGNEVRMVMEQDGASGRVELPPVGSGIHHELVEQLGELSEKGLDFFKLWVPKTLVDDLSASDEVKVSGEGAKIEISMSKPFVRRLCVDPFVNANVCCRMGCPLAAGVAQALAVTTGREVRFEACTYDPRSRTAKTSLTLAKSG